MSTYAQFAADFRRAAVTEERVAAAVASLAERSLNFGPYSVGPLASIEATGRLGAARVRTADAAAPAYAVTLPATLDLSVRLGARSQVTADVEIDVMLTPLCAAGLYLFIDAAPVRAGDVRITLRGRGLGLAVSGIAGGLPSAVTDEVRRQVARQITAALRGSGSRRARTIDIAARVDGTRPRRSSGRLEWVDDDRFGRDFVRHAVSVQRVGDGFAALAGQPLSIGPLKTGPVTVRGEGAVDPPSVTPVEAADPTFAVTVPLHLDLVVGLGREHRYRADVVARLVAVARPSDRVRIEINIAPLTRDDVTLTVQAADRLAARLGRAGKLDDRIATQVVRIVNGKVAAADRTVDVGAIVGGNFGGGSKRPRPTR